MKNKIEKYDYFSPEKYMYADTKLYIHFWGTPGPLKPNQESLPQSSFEIKEFRVPLELALFLGVDKAALTGLLELILLIICSALLYGQRPLISRAGGAF